MTDKPKAVRIVVATLLLVLLIVSTSVAQSLTDETNSRLSRKSTRVLMGATDYGTGAFGFHRLGKLSQTNFIVGGGIFSARDLADRTIDGAVYSQRGVLLPLRFGIRNEFFRQELPSLEWAFYWVGTVGSVLAFGYPQGLEFQQTLSHTTVGLGGEVYNALGLEAYFGVGFALYLEGGVYAMNTFASRSLFVRGNYFGPSLAFGIRTGF